MITIKDYVASRNISYEAARKSLRKYEKELSGHLVNYPHLEANAS